VHWHPLIVHFPVALTLSAAGCFIVARFAGEKLASRLALIGTFNLCLGAVAALIALGTGLGSVLDLNVSDAAHQAISTHMKSALFTTLALILLAVWRGAGTAADSRPSPVFLVIMCGASLALGFTAYRGTLNVYHFGVGIEDRSAVHPP
jgi:uncharacterized membrane protein